MHNADSSIDLPIKNRKRPPEALLTADTEIIPPVPLHVKQKRINWGEPGPQHEKMSSAIDHWLNDREDRFGKNGERIKDYVTYANACGIPPLSVYRYIHPDVSKQIQLGDGSCGKEKLLTDEEVQFMGHILAGQDHASDGLLRNEAKDIIMDVSKKDITFSAASRQLTRCVLPVNVEKNMLKATLQKAQAPTSDQTNINIAQQY
jgi:hypothetical protein